MRAPGNRAGRRTSLPILALIVVLLVQGLICAPAAHAATLVNLGTATTYSLLGATAVANTASSKVSGDIGTYPGVAVTGFPPGLVNGTVHAGDAAAGQAQADAMAAYNAAAAQVPTGLFAGDLGGTTKTPGVYYSSGAVTISSTFTLDAGGDPNAVFIFQIGAAFAMGASASVNLINGAQSSRVFWQVLGAASFGAAAKFTGTVLGLGAISFAAGCTVVGRAFAVAGGLALDSSVVLPEGPVKLATAGAYSVLAGTSVVNSGATTMSGDLGVSPGTVLTGFPPGTTSGSTHVNDISAQQAQVDLTAAYNDAAARPSTASLSGNLGGQTLTAGIYSAAAALTLTGTLLLDGQGNTNGVFILQLPSTLTTSAGSAVKVINGAQVSRIFWQVAGSVNLGSGSAFLGTVLSQGSITVGSSTGFTGRALSRSGAVTLNATALSSEAPIPLGAALSYALLSNISVANTGLSTVTGDVGTSPGVAVTGFPPGIIIGGQIHLNDANAGQAEADVKLAYDEAAARVPTGNIAGDLAGQTFRAGTYKATAAIAISTPIFLDGQGNPNAVFIFQIGAAFNIAASSNIFLVNGAQASRVFWQVLGAVTMGANCGFIGTILGAGAITIGAGCAITGRALSYIGAVVIDSSTFISPEPVSVVGPLAIVATGATLSSVTLNGMPQTATGSSTEWTISDPRGTGAEWTVTAEATTPTSAAGLVEVVARTLSVGNLTITPGTVVADTGADPSTGISAPPLALSVSPQALITTVGPHRGNYLLTPSFSLVIPPNAYRSNYSGVINSSTLNPYVSVLTVTIS